MNGIASCREFLQILVAVMQLYIGDIVNHI